MLLIFTLAKMFGMENPKRIDFLLGCQEPPNPKDEVLLCVKDWKNFCLATEQPILYVLYAYIDKSA